MSHVRITGMRPHRESDPCGLPFSLSNVARRPVLIGIPCPAGMTRGGHFHTQAEGRHKMPEIVFVAMGTLELVTYRVDSNGQQDGLEHSMTVEAGMRIEIPTFVYHTLTAKTDAFLVEYCYTPDDVSRKAR